MRPLSVKERTLRFFPLGDPLHRRFPGILKKAPAVSSIVRQELPRLCKPICGGALQRVESANAYPGRSSEARKGVHRSCDGRGISSITSCTEHFNGFDTEI
ncbi:hypothetical protein ARMSODRAFT_960643 [Armillaria solidipes]|uniref:Uncharacterized protein n=1 Tax=Armillaria solidipes TaxID=1076256 RepID=A0A2H3BB93_9AGAR|nr:hypothetical protein ARMSODRAFT_960643 [Armillaria solidipes]